MSERPIAIILGEMRHYAERAYALVDGVDIDDHLEDWVKQFALERAVELIGECAKQLERIRPDLPLPWRELTGVRNILAHAYHRVDQELLFVNAQEQIPPLLDALAGIDSS